MKLIKTLDSRLESKTAKPGQTKRFGLFECPVCKEHVEKPLTDGKRNKTCGKQECRKAAFKSGNSTKINPNAVSNKKYYTVISTFYRRLVSNKHIHLDDSLDTLQKFIQYTYEELAILKDKVGHEPISIIPIDKSLPISKDNFKFVCLKDATISPDKYVGDLQYCCRRLMHESGKSYVGVYTAITKLNVPNKESIIVTDYGNELKTRIVSKEDYYALLNTLRINSSTSTSNFLYLINCEGYTKIGITHNVNSRLSSLDGSSPFTTTLIYSVDLGPEAYNIEQYLHKQYVDFNVKKEWFKLSKNQIEELKYKLSSKNILKEYNEHVENEENTRISEIRAQRDNAYEYSKLKYEQRLKKGREANKKPEVEVIVNEDREEYVHDRSAQIEAITKHGMIGTPIYNEWRRIVRHNIDDSWRDSKIFIPTMVDEFNAFEGRPRIVAKTDGPIGPNNYKIVDVEDVPVVSGVIRGIAQLDKEGNEIARFTSAAEAARCIPGVIPGKIPAVCKGTRKSHAGFKWKYTE